MKTKKSIFLITFILGFTLFSYSQEINQKLLVKFSTTELQEMKLNNPDNYNFMDYFVSDALYFVDMPPKDIEYKELIRINPQDGKMSSNQAITEADLENFNPLEYNVEYDLTKTTYYLAGNTGKLLVVHAYNDLKSGSEYKIKISKLNKK